MSVQYRGIWVVRTDSLKDTALWLVQAEEWFAKAEHLSLGVRPKVPRGAWEDPDRHFWLRVLQSFDGISVVTAGAIYDQAKADGIPLLTWVPDEAWFTKRVKGVGKGRAKTLIESLNGRTP
jgi:hypothetical protein